MTNTVTIPDPNQFLSVLKRMQLVTNPKSPLPILGYVSLRIEHGALVVHGTDLECSVVDEVSLSGLDENTLSPLCVKLEPLYQAFKNLPKGGDSITLEAYPTQLHVVLPRGVVSAPLLPYEDFPQVPVPKDRTFTTTCAGSELRKGLDLVTYAAGDDPTRTTLSAVCCDVLPGALGLAAADGYRLAYSRVLLDDPDQEAAGERFLVRQPSRLAKLLPNDPITLGFGPDNLGHQIKVSWFTERGSTRIIQDGVAGTYPDYRRIVPQGRMVDLPTCIIMSRKELLEAVAAVKYPGVKGTDVLTYLVAISQDEVSLRTVQDGEVREARLLARVIHAGEPVAFNRRFVDELVRAMPGEFIVDGAQKASQPTKWGSTTKGVATAAYGVIMPIHLSKLGEDVVYPDGYPEKWMHDNFRDDVQTESTEEEPCL